MQKYRTRNRLLDKLHKGFVLTCLGVTVYAGAELGIHFYKYYTQVKPEKDRQQLLENQDLLMEGISPDKAPTIT